MDALESFGDDWQAAGTETETGTGLDPDALIEIVDVGGDDGGPRSPYELLFPAAMVWGLMGCATSFAINFVRERNSGTWLRLQVSALSRAQVLAGKALACTLAGLAASGVLLVVGVVALGVRVGSPGLLLLAMLGASLCFTGLMMVLSQLGRTEGAVAGGSWVVMMPLAMIGGGMIPLVVMPPWLRTLSHVSPFKWAIYAIEGAVWRDLSAGQMVLPLLLLLGIAAAAFGLGMLVFRRREP